MFSAVISEHFSKNCMIISVVAAKYGILKMCGFYWATLYSLLCILGAPLSIDYGPIRGLCLRAD